MKKRINYLTLLALGLTLLITGCASLDEKRNEAISQSTYAVGDSLDKGRVDLAGKYNKESQKLILPPKKRIKIDKIETKDGKSYVFLPPNLANKEVIVVESEEYKTLLTNNKSLADKLEKEKKSFEKYEGQINDLKRELEEEKKKNAEKGFFSKIKSWFTGISVLLGISAVGLGVLCFFNPALIPIIIKLVGSVIEIIVRIVKAIIDWIKYIITWIQEWNNKS